MKRALVTGVTGQDGSYLSELLADAGFEVHGTVRPTSRFPEGLDHSMRELLGRVVLHEADLTDEGNLTRLIDSVRPSVVYNLAAQSSVSASFEQPVHTGDVTGLGAVRLIEAIRLVDPSIRFYQASSSEMFGSAPPPQNESTPFHPRSPYAAAKLYAHWTTINYRDAYGMHASAGILFNHESPRRGSRFVTRKITSGAAEIACGIRSELVLGNLDVRRDWGHARDYAQAMFLIAEHPEPMTFVIGTGESRTVREFAAAAFDAVGLRWEDHVRIDAGLYRAAEVEHVQADASLAREVLGWEPTVTFEQMVEEMVQADLRAKQDLLGG